MGLGCDQARGRTCLPGAQGASSELTELRQTIELRDGSILFQDQEIATLIAEEQELRAALARCEADAARSADAGSPRRGRVGERATAGLSGTSTFGGPGGGAGARGPALPPGPGGAESNPHWLQCDWAPFLASMDPVGAQDWAAHALAVHCAALRG